MKAEKLKNLYLNILSKEMRAMYHDLTNHSNKLKINIYDKSVL